MRLEHDSVQGPRRMARLLLRQASAGEPIMLLDRPDAEISDAIAPGTDVRMHVQLLSRARWRLGAIKNAYLGACLLVGDIVQTPEADAIRADLLAARDVPRNATLVESPQCASLAVYRTRGPAVPGKIALVQIQPDGSGPPELCVSLARTLIVSWPLGGHFVGARPPSKQAPAGPVA